MAKVRLFDDEVELYSGPATETESSFHFLNRAKDPEWVRVRELLEQWYSQHADPDGDLRSRFRKHDIRQHAPAWWELYIGALFRQLGFDVTVHPDLPAGSGHPDFMVSDDTSRMYVECVVLFQNRPPRGNPDAQAWLLECISTMSNPDFLVDVDIDKFGTQRPRKADIVRKVNTWLESLDYELALTLDPADATEQRFVFNDWEVTLTAVPVMRQHRGEPGRLVGRYPMSGVYIVTSTEDIRKLLKAKATQCRGVNAPLIIAVHNYSTFAHDDDMEEALYGSVAYQYYEDVRDSTQPIRQPNGYWHPGPPARGADVSAVMFSEHLHPYNVADVLPSLWLNPWAARPLSGKMPLQKHTATDNGTPYVAEESEVAADKVFGLPNGWPLRL
ncbi:hypothetical protein [Mycolicibacterium mengxianglii]|uniref:hypothetical protein n=1 Tax=Mycolicibacterium mengxianglii TaxID=2736649 RepID=UPI0018EF2CF6|nr:hypothetical protein [Mycolicibacterium mengxianglii]